MLAVFKAYGNAEFAGDAETTLGTYTLIVLYGLASLPLSYCYSFLFSSHTSAQVGVTGLHFIAGFVCVIANFIMKSIESTQDANDVLVKFYRLLPPFNFGEGLINISTRGILKTNGKTESLFQWEVVGRNYTYLGSFAFAKFFLFFSNPAPKLFFPNSGRVYLLLFFDSCY